MPNFGSFYERTKVEMPKQIARQQCDAGRGEEREVEGRKLRESENCIAVG